MKILKCFNIMVLVTVSTLYPSFSKNQEGEKEIKHPSNPFQLSIIQNPSETPREGSTNFFCALGQHPQFGGIFAGLKSVQKLELSGISTFLASLNNIKSSQKNGNYHIFDPKLKGVFQKMLFLMKDLKHQNVEFLRQEIEDKIKGNSLSRIDIMLMPWRILGAISGKASTDALDLFKNFKGTKVHNILCDSGGWKNPYTTMAALGFLKIENRRAIDKSVTLSIEIQKRLDKKISKKMNLQNLEIPLFEKNAILGHGSLAYLFAQGKFPYVISEGQSHAHAIEMTELLMGLHDYIHGVGLQDEKENSYMPLAESQASILLKNIYEVNKIIDELSDYISNRHELVMKGIQSLFTHIVRGFISQEDFTNLKKATAGFYLIIHESFLPNQHVWSSHSLSYILEHLVEQSKKMFIKKNERDIFKTDPLTGKSTLTEKEIRETIKKHPEFFFSKYDESPSEILKKDEFEYTLKEHPISTFVTIIGKGGKVFKEDFETLKYFFDESKDKESLLKLAGYEIHRPDLTQFENPWEVAIDYIHTLDSNIKESIDFFEKAAKFFMTESLNNWFFNESRLIPKPTECRPIILPVKKN